MKQYVLGCKRTRDKNTTELSSWLRRQYKFIPHDDLAKNRSLVVPFIIITDGHDVMSFMNEHGVFDLGFSTVVKTKRQFFKSRSRFDEMVVGAIKKNFMRLMEGTVVHLDDDVDEMSEKYFDIIDPYHAVSSRDDMQIFPIYILKIANTRINIPEGNEMAGFCAIDVEWIKNNWENVRTTHVSRVVGWLISEEVLKLPEPDKGVFQSVP